MKVVPQKWADVEKCRYGGEEFTPDAVPEKFLTVTLGQFEVFVDGRWRKCKGSYMMGNEPAVWMEE